MKPQPLISVALSVYNGACFLARQLDSVLNQRDVTLEVVVVDDGSQDGSVALLREYAQRDPRVRLHFNPDNLGPTRSFERAMSLCRGDFIAPCDQDDFWQPEKLAALLAAIGDHDLAYCNSEYIDSDDHPTGRRVSDDLSMMSGSRPMQFVFANSVSGHAALLRRSLFEAVRPLPPTLYYDWVLAMFAAARGGIVYVDRVLVQFRRHQQAFSSLGKESSSSLRGRNRAWFEDRRLLLHALAASRFDGRHDAARMSEVLALAVFGNTRWPLLRTIWHQRAALPPGHGSPLLNALRLQSRVLRKLRRARAEPESVELQTNL